MYGRADPGLHKPTSRSQVVELRRPVTRPCPDLFERLPDRSWWSGKVKWPHRSLSSCSGQESCSGRSRQPARPWPRTWPAAPVRLVFWSGCSHSRVISWGWHGADHGPERIARRSSRAGFAVCEGMQQRWPTWKGGGVSVTENSTDLSPGWRHATIVSSRQHVDI